MADRRHAPVWRLANGRALDLDRARIIAILNVTPDSFSDGGRINDPAEATTAARAAIDAGADMLDIGGESTRPGAVRVNSAEQIRRVAPAIEAIRRAGVEAPISIDTTRADVAKAALDAGADAVNDVSAGLEDDDMLPLVAARGAGVILMHRLRPPGDDSYSDKYTTPPDYTARGGVVEVVRAFLAERMVAAVEAGVRQDAIVLDPGLGFGKTVEQNLEIVRATAEFVSLGRPVLGAASRKSFVGRISGVENPRDRVAGSIAISVVQRLHGALLFRVHDVSAHVEALRLVDRTPLKVVV